MPQDSIFTIESNGKVYKIQAPSNSTESQLQLAIAGHNSSSQGSAPSLSATVDNTKVEPIKSPYVQPAGGTGSIGPTKSNIATVLEPLVNKLAPDVQSTVRAGINKLPANQKEAVQDTKGLVSAGIGLAAGLATENPLAGSFAMAGTDAVLNSASGERNPSLLYRNGATNPIDPNNVIEGTVLGTISNELLGRVIELAGSASSTAWKTITGQLKPGDIPWTTAQSLPEGTAKQRITKWIEDVGAPLTKQRAVDAQNLVHKSQIEDELSRISGQNIKIGSTSTLDLAEKIQKEEVKPNFIKSVAASGKTAEDVKNIANSNPLDIVTNQGATTTSTVLDPAGNPIVNAAPQTVKTIKGPIQLDNTLTAAKDIYEEGIKGLTKNDPVPPAIESAKKILTEADAFQPDGSIDITKASPISFEQAWEFKKKAGEHTFGDPFSDVNVKHTKFGNVYTALDKDIENSIPNWGDQKVQNLTNQVQAVGNLVNLYSQQIPKDQFGRELALAEDVLSPQEYDEYINAIDKHHQLSQQLTLAQHNQFQSSSAALNAWNKTKEIVSNRYEQFMPKGEIGASTEGLINARDVQLDKLRGIIHEANMGTTDTSKLQRLLNTGDLNGLINNNSSQYSSIAPTNTRDFLKGFHFTDLVQQSTKQLENGQTTFNPTQLYQLWQGVENKPATKLIYNQVERARMGQFLKNVSLTDQKFSNTAQHFLQYRGLYAGLGAASGLLGYMIDNISPTKALLGSSAIAGLELGMGSLGKLAINPQTAKIMQDLASDQMSTSGKFAARMIANVLRGQTVYAVTKDGQRIPVKIK